MGLLDRLAERHTEWVKMVRSFKGKDDYTISVDTANELVQEMYLRLYKYVNDTEKIMYGDEINTMFVYITLKRMYFKYKEAEAKRAGKFIAGEDEDWEDEEYSDHTDDSKVILCKEIIEEIDSWHHYDSKLFKTIVLDGYSMRQLSRESGISLSSIFNTMKHRKELLKSKFGNQYDKIGFHHE